MKTKSIHNQLQDFSIRLGKNKKTLNRKVNPKKVREKEKLNLFLLTGAEMSSGSSNSKSKGSSMSTVRFSTIFCPLSSPSERKTSERRQI